MRRTPMPLRWHIQGASISVLMGVLSFLFWKTTGTPGFALLSAPLAVFVAYQLLRTPVGSPVPIAGFSRRDLPYTAYLVLTLDVSKSPPVALSIDVFSSSARDLTIVSRTTHTVDLERMDALTYHDARKLLLDLAPRQWPWMSALIRKDP